MDTPGLKARLFWATEAVLLAGTLLAAAWFSRPEEWHPLLLVVLLLALALLGEWLGIETRNGQLSASFVALIMAMSLLGPGPAVALGVAAMVLTSARKRLRPAFWLGNLTTYAVSLFVGGLMARALAGNVHAPHSHATRGVAFALIVFGVFLVVTALNTVLIAVDVHIGEGRSLVDEFRDSLPVLPGQLATGILATVLVIAFANLGLSMLVGSVVVLLIFRHLTVALLRSEERAEQLEIRSRQLVGLQLGVLRTLMRALGARDETTARHAAAVAAYASALAEDLTVSEAEQEVIHVAGLLHDIGKFTWPDRVLHADVLGDEERETIRAHPSEGAVLVGALDGYGEVADAILYHHERIDGRGYPAGLIGNEIPLASRIVAVCSTYDTMTASHTYRSPMTPKEAMVELRNAAGHGQLDADLVERFVAVLERLGPTFGQDASLEGELDFKRRVRKLAEVSSETSGRDRSSDHSGGRGWRVGIAEFGQRALNKA